MISNDNSVPLRLSPSISKNAQTKEDYGSIEIYPVQDEENQEQEQPLQEGTSPTTNRRFPKRGLSSLSTMSVRDLLNSSSLASLTGGDDLCSSVHIGGSATLLSQISNLVKNIVGCGVLSLPSGIASLASKTNTGGSTSGIRSTSTINSGEQQLLPPTMFDILLPSISLIFITGLIFGYYFTLLGRVCSLSSSSTFRGAWERTVKHGSVVVVTANLLKPAMGNLSLSIILTDTLQSLLQTAGFHNTSRIAVLLLCSTLGVLPLCLIKSLKTLAPFSAVGLIAMVITAISMGVRYLDGSYERGGRFINDLPHTLRPSFEFGLSYADESGNRDNHDNGSYYHYFFSPQILILACMLFEAFIAHYNAPRFYVELKNNTTRRFAILSSISFFASSVFYAFIACVGFLTFGVNSDGYIINNYSTNDPIATICRVAIFISVLLTYPVIFIGFRDGILDQFMIPIEKQTNGNLNIITIILVGIITFLAVWISDLSVVNAVGGGTLGTMIVFVFPTLMFGSAIKDSYTEATLSQKMEVWITNGLMVFGIAMGFVGVQNALLEKTS